ncbi:hypothetical protein ACISK3_15095 [Morganella morganii]|nr:hypothetical protein [Morganella morganii]
MKAKTTFIIGLLLSAAIIHLPSYAAIKKETIRTPATRNFLFIENNTDNNFFITPLDALDPRLTGSNRWTGLKATDKQHSGQQSLGYVDPGKLVTISKNEYVDMWLDNAPISHPFLGLRCINWYKSCNLDSGMISPQSTDQYGFYGSFRPDAAGGIWGHALLADSVYYYVKQISPGSALELTVNICRTKEQYDAARGQRCKDQNSGEWLAGQITHIKDAHLRLNNTNSMSEVFINSDGIPLLGEGNTDCHTIVLNNKSGLVCKMVSYSLEANKTNSRIRINPSINNPALSAAIDSRRDFQFSLNGTAWRNLSSGTKYFTLDDMKGSDSLYIFMSADFFKQMVKLGIADANTRDLFNIQFRNTLSPESGWYEFSTSTALIIKPRDFGVSIISEDYQLNPHRDGKVEKNAEPLNFDYIVTTSGKTAADQVLISVTGPAGSVKGKPYCIFSSPDNKVKVPFPAYLTFTTQKGRQVENAPCDGIWHDMTNALWAAAPWTDISGDAGLLNKTNVTFSIPMDNKISERTVDDIGWYGDVSASGKIHVRATWRNVK